MTRKDYVAFAEAIRTISDLEERRRVAQMVAQVFKSDNSRFDYTRFYAACAVDA